MSKAIVTPHEDGSRTVAFYCFACQEVHEIELGPEDQRPINVENPTVYKDWNITTESPEGAVLTRCHGQLRYGKYKFYQDCSHQYKGDTSIPMADYPAK